MPGAAVGDASLEGRPGGAILLVAALRVYAAVALAVDRRWISGLVAPLVAALLWWRHRRARFSAYVFFSVVAIGGLVVHAWWAMALAAGAIPLLQSREARRTWPRLRPGAVWRAL